MFITLFANFAFNVFGVVDKELFIFFERQPEGLVVGRLARAQSDGIFSRGGFSGMNYNEKDTTTTYASLLALQHNLYITEQETPPDFFPYLSQTGGQGILLSALQKVSPLSNANNLKVFKFLNCLLSALCFSLLLGWIRRNYGMLATSITFVLLLFSPLIILYSRNLWWVVWNFYIPFLTMLLVLEKRAKNPFKYPNNKIYIYAFIAVFVKCFFTGFEFITTTLVAAMCPVFYYLWIEQNIIKKSILLFIKTSLVMVLAVVAGMFVLVIQHKALFGNWTAGFDYIIHSYFKRTEFHGDSEQCSLGDVLNLYTQGNVFNLNFLPDGTPQVYFGVLTLIIATLGLYIYVWSHRLYPALRLKYQALFLTFILSLIAPFSWFVIFKEHAWSHPHLDYITWYMPSLLIGFAIIGTFFSILFKKEKQSFNVL